MEEDIGTGSMPEHEKKKRSNLQVISLVVKMYAKGLIYRGIPILVIVLQICQVWADSPDTRLAARLMKISLIIFFISYTLVNLHQRILIKREKNAITEEESKTSPFVEEEQVPVVELIEEREQNGELTVSAAELEKKQESVIAEDIYINGTIETNNDLAIFGNVDGNVYCGGNVRLYGLVTGNIRCKNLYLDKTEIEGDIHCDERIYLSDKSIVIGDIVAWEMICKGCIRGNAFIKRRVRFEESTQMVGDVTSMEIIVQEGAAIQGNMHIQTMV